MKWHCFQFLVSSSWEHTLLQSPNNNVAIGLFNWRYLTPALSCKGLCVLWKENWTKNKIKLEVCPYLYLVAHIMAGHVACWFEIIFLGNKQATANNWCCDLKLGKSCASNITQASDARSSTILLEEQTRIVRDCWLLLKRFNTSVAMKTIDQGITKMN